MTIFILFEQFILLNVQKQKKKERRKSRSEVSESNVRACEKVLRRVTHAQGVCLGRFDLGFVVCLSFIKGSTRNYLKPKRKTNKQMHDFVKVCLMPIDQLPRIASVSQTSGFRIIQRNSSAVDLWFHKQYRSSQNDFLARYLANFTFIYYFLTCKSDLQI